MAAALALVLTAVTGCSSKHLTPEQQAQANMEAYAAQIRKVVADPARADQLVALTTQYQQQMRESAAVVRDYRAKLAALNANYEATREDFETLFSQQDAHREALLRKVAALREQITALTTDAEWHELEKARQRMLDADIQDLVS
jgi:uncharacterized coiled-coil DUF342 family protein